MLVLLSLLTLSLAQQVTFDETHNITSLEGTWASGSGGTQTGIGFANPVNFTFNYPKTTGISHSFTNDGFFEEAQYRFNGNGSMPNCIQGVVIFQHGRYELNPNGSLILHPFVQDGRIQVQDACAGVSNIITQFNQTTLYAAWNIFQDISRGPYLQLIRFDGALLPPQYLVANPPNMLPTTTLTPASNNTQSVDTAHGGAFFVVRGSAESRWRTSVGIVGLTAFASLATLASSLALCSLW